MIKLYSGKREIKFITSIFPDNTSQVWQLDKLTKKDLLLTIVWNWENESEIFHLIQLCKFIRSQFSSISIILKMLYLPFARQDKWYDNNSTFALRVFVDLINSLNFYKVITFDAHSPVAVDVINRLTSKDPGPFIRYSIKNFDADYVFFPDHGAKVRYEQNIQTSYFYGEKVRNQTTGKIEKYNLIIGNPKALNDSKILIIDDLCDRGGTFIHAAKVLKKYKPKQIGLCVSHGLFTDGFDKMEKTGISKFYTTNSLLKNKKGYKIV